MAEITIANVQLPGPFTIVWQAVAVEKLNRSDISQDAVDFSLETRHVTHLVEDGREIHSISGRVLTLVVTISEILDLADQQACEDVDNMTIQSLSAPTADDTLTILAEEAFCKAEIDGYKTKITFISSCLPSQDWDTLFTGPA